MPTNRYQNQKARRRRSHINTPVLKALRRQRRPGPRLRLSVGPARIHFVEELAELMLRWLPALNAAAGKGRRAAPAGAKPNKQSTPSFPGL